MPAFVDVDIKRVGSMNPALALAFKLRSSFNQVVPEPSWVQIDTHSHYSLAIATLCVPLTS